MASFGGRVILCAIQYTDLKNIDWVVRCMRRCMLRVDCFESKLRQSLNGTTS